MRFRGSLLLAVLALTLPALARAAGDETTSVHGGPGHTGFINDGRLDQPPLQVAWTKTLGRISGQPLVAGETVFVIATQPNETVAKLFALNVATGEVRWSRAVANGTEITYDDGRVFASDGLGIVSAFSATTGR